MTNHELPHNVLWRKSSRSGNGGSGSGNCVEVAFGENVVAARDSKAPDDGALILSAARWSSFLTDLRTGRYDL